jgi:ribosomal protein L11 methylase PrmA
LIESLRTTVKALSWEPKGTEWTDYYDDTNYSEDAFNEKRDIVKDLVLEVKPAFVWDLGANTGIFSQAAIEAGAEVIAFDIDPGAVDKNYLDSKKRKEKAMLPLVLDLTNPSPALGWANEERESFMERGPADMVLALALIHHLAISNNVPLPMLADYFSQCSKWLVIEFVPKEDSQVQRLLSTREDIFDHYNQEDFEAAFKKVFHIRKSIPVKGSKRQIYLMEVR